jgi:ribose transport system permease protein
VISAGLAGVAGIAYASYNSGQSQTNGISYELYAIAGAVLGGCSLRGGEGSVIGILIGSSVIRLIHNGFNMFRYPLEKMMDWGASMSSSNLAIVRLLGRLLNWIAGSSRTTVWHPDENWKEIVFGTVILVAVVLDQIAHIIQASRRTRKVSVPPAASKTTEVLTPPPAAAGQVPG